MKRTIAIFLALLLVLSLAACGGGSTTTNAPTTAESPTTTDSSSESPRKPDDVLEVEALIDAIGEVSVKSKGAIDLAEKEFEYLTPSKQELVENYSTLKRAQDTFKDLYSNYILGDWVRLSSTYTFYEGGKGLRVLKTEDTNETVFTWTQKDDILTLKFWAWSEVYKIDVERDSITDTENEEFVLTKKN